MKAVQFWVIVFSVILMSGFSVNATYNTEYNPCIKLIKTGPETAVPGETIPYHFMVKNCGNIPFLSGYKVFDNLFATEDNPNGLIRNSDIYPGEVHEFEMTYLVTEDDCGDLINKARAVGYYKDNEGLSTNVKDYDTWTTNVDCDAKASLGDFVWLDMDSNGIQDTGEPGFEGVVVNLYDCSNTLMESAITDGGGFYLFDELTPGCYVVQFERPTRFEFTSKNSGSDNTVDSDVLPSGTTEQILLDPGETDLTWDAGLITIATSEIGDFVWKDLNANGIQDAGEPGIAGVTVSLFNCSDNLIMTKKTDANGFYLFTDLPAGDYYVVFETPTGYIPSPKDAGPNDMDSDADMTTGRTDCTSLDVNESDRTWDAGFYRPASLGDFVWEDTSSDGIQDEDELGIELITVNLYDCNDNFISSETTDANGKYLFDNLMPGDYYVEFIIPSGYIFSPQDAGGDDMDSDAAADTGKTICTTLISNENDITWDAGMLPEPCILTVTKSCFVPPPPPAGAFDCDKPIDSLTMIWDGGQNIRIRAWKGTVGSTLLADIDNITPDKAITVTGYAGSPNDVYWEIFEAGTLNKIGESKFHLSCSDDEMDGPEDCGNYEGNGKSNEAGLINKWILAGMVDSKSSFNCFPTDPAPVSTCKITAPSQDLCTDKLKALILKYVGGDCSDTSNWQEGKFKCSGDSGQNAPVEIVITKDADKITVVPDGDSIMINDEISLIADSELASETKFDIVQGGVVLQSLNIHTSCSKPIKLGDRFGSLQVVALDLKNGEFHSIGGDVEYTYVVTNTGELAATNITVSDDSIQGGIPGSPIALLGPGESRTLETTEFVKKTTTNLVTVKGDTDLGGTCTAEASSTVTVVVPQQECKAAGASTLRLGSGDPNNKFEWELFNNGPEYITIKTLSLSWPARFGKLKKIKLGGDTIFEPDEVDRPTAPFVKITNFRGDLNKRQIQDNDDDKLTFEFEQKAAIGQNDFTIMVDFYEGCSVNYNTDCDL